ncbi:hypothetical protein WAI453_004250 [Rhynchosporium graminicola]
MQNHHGTDLWSQVIYADIYNNENFEDAVLSRGSAEVVTFVVPIIFIDQVLLYAGAGMLRHWQNNRAKL